MHNKDMTPKGKLLIIGGHEDKGETPGENLHIDIRRKSASHFEILGAIISRTPGAHHIIEIIASASAIPEEMEDMYIQSYKKAGFYQIGFIKVENVADACNPASIKRIQNAHAVFFTGGDQNRLISLLANTELMEAVYRKYIADRNFIVAGTSAGAMVMPGIIIAGGKIGSALFQGAIEIEKGFGLIDTVIVDTHFIKRGRFGRLAHAVTLNQRCLGIGLEEDTAVFISESNHLECIGSGMAIIIDGSKIGMTNIDSVGDNVPIVVGNLIVSIIAEGSHYLIDERKFTDKSAAHV